MSEKKPANRKPFSLHPMKVNDALRVMLNTPPMKKKPAKRISKGG
jgi:hypothetical protein